MKYWKKLFISCLVSVVLFSVAIALGGCAEKDIVCTLYTYDDNSLEVKGKRGEAVALPDDVEREGYIFDGWYTGEGGTGTLVSEAFYDEDTSYYAKWAWACTITFDANGGSISTTSIKAKEGADVYSVVQDYVASKAGDYRFGGWFVGDKALTQGTRLTRSGITLTARYMAPYTINVSYQNELRDGYIAETPIKGYALIDEELEEPTKNGFSLTPDSTESFLIDEDASNNVFTAKFDRNLYTLTLLANYPDGTTDIINSTHYFGVEFSMPETPFSVEGSRFLGWALTNNAGVNGLIKEETYALSGDTDLYAIWNVGYSDLFDGKDYVYVSAENPNSAVISRGGIDIEGTFDEDRDLYNFKQSDAVGAVSLTVKLNRANRTFVYYGQRQGAYTLYEQTSVNDSVKIILNQADGITYTDTSATPNITKKGTYTVAESGIYTAHFEDGTSFEFILSRLRNGTQVFRIRGEEAGYGLVALFGTNFPAFMFDGFGNALMLTSTDTSNAVSYTYVVNKEKTDIFTLSSSGRDDIVIRIKQYENEQLGEVYGFEIYEEQFDTMFINGSHALVLDGCSTAVMKNGNDTVYEGVYTTELSLQPNRVAVSGGQTYIVTVSVDNSTTYRYKVFKHAMSGMYFSECDDGYEEYYSVVDTQSGKALSTPYFIDLGNGRAELYDVNPLTKALDKVSEGTLVVVSDATGDSQYKNNLYLYTAEGTPADWSDYGADVLLLNFDTTSYRYYNTFYVIESVKGDSTVGNAEIYTANLVNDGGEVVSHLMLVLVGDFAILTDGGEHTYSGLWTDYGTFVGFTAYGATRYFILHKDTHGLQVLMTQPMLIPHVKDGKIDYDTTLTRTGYGSTDEETGVTTYDAIYSYVPEGAEEPISVDGSFTYKDITLGLLNATASVFTFVADDNSLTFKFVIGSGTANGASITYFSRFEEDEAITFTTFVQVLEDNKINRDCGIALTDGLTESGENVYIYSDGTNDPISGTISSERVLVFEQEQIDIYSFSSLEGGMQVKFTLLSASNGIYFRLCGEGDRIITYEAKDGNGTLELDTLAHVARYNYELMSYWTGESVFGEDSTAVILSTASGAVYFDIDTEGKYEIRGAEEGTYYMVENGTLTNTSIKLDGHGNATVTVSQRNEQGGDPVKTDYKGSYIVNGEMYTVIYGDDNKAVSGKLGTITIMGVLPLPAFFKEEQGFAGSYVNKFDMSVVVLDSVGNLTKYNSYGVETKGSYIILEDGLFYYENAAGTDAALYTVTGANEVVAADYTKTYYSDDFHSLVFYTNGIVLFDNDDETLSYFVYDEGEGKIYTYSKNGEGTPNKYGFIKSELTVTDNKITYGGRAYTLFDGREITLTDVSGATLKFTPTGEAEFNAAAKYRAADATEDEDYTIVVEYDDNGAVLVSLAKNAQRRISGGGTQFYFTDFHELTVNLGDKTFVYDAENYDSVLTAYSYNYVLRVLSGSSNANQYLGILNIAATVSGDNANYSIDGMFNYVNGTDGNKLTFENGELSKAGYATENHGNLYLAQFTGSDKEIYHMYFFVVQVPQLGISYYLIYSLSRVTSAVTLDAVNNTVIYNEEYIGGDFNVQKSKEIDGTPIYYKAGDAFTPVLRYKGKLVNSYGSIEEEGYNTVLVTLEYTGKESTEFMYYLTLTYDTDGTTITGGSVIARTTDKYEGGEYTVYVLYDLDKTGIESIDEVYYIVKGKNDYKVLSCEKTGKGTFRATVEGGAVYSVTFTETTSESGETVITVTVEPVEEASGGESGTGEEEAA